MFDIAFVLVTLIMLGLGTLALWTGLIWREWNLAGVSVPCLCLGTALLLEGLRMSGEIAYRAATVSLGIYIFLKLLFWWTTGRKR